MRRSKRILIFLIPIVILIAVLAVLFFTKRNSNKVDIEQNDYQNPEISYSFKEVSLNRSLGYRAKITDTIDNLDIIPVDETNTKLKFNIRDYGNKINKINYSILDIVSLKEIKSGNVEDYDKSFSFDVDFDTIGDEKLLNIILDINSDNKIYYYYKIFNSTGVDTYSNIDFVKKFSESTYDPQKADEYTKYMESDVTENTDSFNNLTIYSNYDLLTWGNMNPKVLTDSNIHIKEMVNNNSIRFDIYYAIKLDTEYGEQIYKVKENYRTRCNLGSDFLVEFSRNLTRHINKGSDKYKGVEFDLGLSINKTPYYASKNGKYISIVFDSEIWQLDVENRTLKSIYESQKGKDDIYSYNNDYYKFSHIVQNDDGSVTFTLTGLQTCTNSNFYGDLIYEYDNNKLELVKYIESKKPLAETKDTGIKYASNKNGKYYIKDDKLYQNGLEKEKVIDDNIDKDSIVLQRNGYLVTYNKNNGDTVFFDGKNGKRQVVKHNTKTKIISYIDDDVIIGEYEDNTVLQYNGKECIGYKNIKIYTKEGEVIREYSRTGYYIIDVSIDNNNIKITTAETVGDRFALPKTEFITAENISDNIKVEEYYSKLSRKGYKIIIN